MSTQPSSGRRRVARATAVVSRTPRRAEAEAELLPVEMPPSVLRGMATLMLALAGAAVAFAFLVKMPETVTCKFVLAPEQGTDPLKAPRRGVVEEVGKSEGEMVKAGDLLFVVRSDEFRILADQRKTEEQAILGARSRIKSLESEGVARKLADVAAIGELTAKKQRLEEEQAGAKALDEVFEKKFKTNISVLEKRLDGLRKQLETEERRTGLMDELQKRIQLAYDKKITSEWDAIREKYQFQNAEMLLKQARARVVDVESDIETALAARALEISERKNAETKRAGEIREIDASIPRLTNESVAKEAIARERIGELQASIDASRVKIEGLNGQLGSADGDLYRIEAPYDGVIVSLKAQRAGAVIDRGEILCQLSRDHAPLRAEITVADKDAAQVASGQSVKLLYDAFPYTRYGTRPATLLWVSPTATDGSLRAFAQLEDTTIPVDGHDRPLKPGMAGEARIRTGHRTIVEYVLEPLRRIKENVSAE